MGEPRVRTLPEQGRRVETSVVRFGSDWPGVFVRGDDCFGLFMALRDVINPDAPEFSKRVGKSAVWGFLRLMAESNESDDLRAKMLAGLEAKSDG